MFYSNFLAFFYLFCLKYEKDSDLIYYRPIGLLALCIFMHILLFVYLVQKITNYNILDLLNRNNYYIYISIVLIFVLCLKLYPKKKIDNIVLNYKELSKGKKLLWGFISFTSILLPFFIGGIEYYSKYKNS